MISTTIYSQITKETPFEKDLLFGDKIYTADAHVIRKQHITNSGSVTSKLL